ncbi:MAG: hypothetical protein OSB03_02295 [Vicinamibacterales bacterium]|nr:hypothetical protein [Vicinamibacterales bacterium]
MNHDTAAGWRKDATGRAIDPFCHENTSLAVSAYDVDGHDMTRVG